MRDAAEDVRREARAHLGARRWAEAERCLAAALSGKLGAADSPGDLYLMRALARGERGDRRGARDDLREGLARGASLDEGVALFSRLGLVNEALAAIERHAAEPELRAGRLAMRFGRHREAIAALRRARDPRARSELAERLAELGDVEAALATLGTGSRRRRAEWLAALGRREEARALVRRDPPDGDRITEAALALALGATDDAVALAETTQHDALLAQIACYRGDAEAGKRHAEAALAQGAPEALRWRGIARWLLGESGALDDLDRFLATAPDDAEALLWRGEIHRQMGRLEAALADIERGITATAGYPVAGHASRLCTIIAGQYADREVMHPDAYAELLVLLAPVIGSSTTALTGAEVRERLERALVALAGNRSPRPTFVVDGRLVPLDTPAHTRFSARTVQERLRVRPAKEVIAELEALYAARPEPTVLCHVGEIHLWLGDAASAAASFQRALDETAEVRWAYVGLCAAALLAGDLDDALGWCRRGEERFPPPGRTMFAYRAEVHRRRGDREAARADLAQTLRDTPERISAWLNLALLERGPRLADVFERLRKRAPGLVADASRTLTGDEIFAGEPEALFEHVLTMMRGNRSSSFVSYFADGALRFVPPRRPRSVSSGP